MNIDAHVNICAKINCLRHQISSKVPCLGMWLLHWNATASALKIFSLCMGYVQIMDCQLAIAKPSRESILACELESSEQISVAHPLHPVNGRSRGKRRNLWVGRCVSS